MFTNLRQSAQSFFAKLILFFLVGMFALWGIGDVFRGMGAGPSIVATVAKTQIPLQKFQRMVQNSHEQPIRVLRSLIDSLLLEKEESTQGIIVDDETIANYLANLPEFKGKDGQFDKTLYQAYLTQTGETEASFVEHTRREVSGKLLLGSLTSEVQVPFELAMAVYRMQEEQRAANFLVITPAMVEAKVSRPTDQEIKAYYDAHAKDFTAPEVRTLSFVTLPLEGVQAKIEVPEDEIKRTYEERKEDFRMPERRQVDDMEFDNEQDARDAAKELSAGKTFSQVAATAPLSNKGKTSLGFLAGTELPSEAAKVVGPLKLNGITAPTLANFRWHIYRVSAVEAARVQTLDEARPGIAKEMAGRQAQETSQRMMNGFEDSLAGGATFEQAAEKIGQKVKTAGPLDKSGNMPDGNKADLPPYDNFLATAFSLAEKDHSQAVEATDGSYFVVRVDSVKGEHVKPLEQVKEQAARAAMAEKVNAKLAQVAEDVSDKLRAGKQPGGMPAPVAAQGLKRGSETVPEGALKDKSIPPLLKSELFSIHLHESTHAYPADGGNYMIATLTGITPAPQKPDMNVMKDINKDLYDTLTEESLQRYVNIYLRGKYPVTINAAALEPFLKNQGNQVSNEEGGE